MIVCWHLLHLMYIFSTCFFSFLFSFHFILFIFSLFRVRKYDHITPILHTLHWLPVSSRIEYKVCLLTHQCIHSNAPSYLKELIKPPNTTRSLRSSNTNSLQTIKTNLRTMGDRAFCAAAPRLWNALPDHLRAPQTTDAFKRGLKTFLFTKAFA